MGSILSILENGLIYSFKKGCEIREDLINDKILSKISEEIENFELKLKDSGPMGRQDFNLINNLLLKNEEFLRDRNIYFENLDNIYKSIYVKGLVISHGDLNNKNIIIDHDSISFIDFEYVGYYIKYWDLATFLSKTFNLERDLRIIINKLNIDFENIIKVIYIYLFIDICNLNKRLIYNYSRSDEVEINNQIKKIIKIDSLYINRLEEQGELIKAI